MGELTSKFSRDDIEVLLEATNDWESIGSHEWHLMNMVKGAPVPDEEQYPEAHEMVTSIKDHFKKREKDIKDSRVTRQERAVFLKAKLMLVRRDMGINQLFEMATEYTKATDKLTGEQDGPIDYGDQTEDVLARRADQRQDALMKAEFFIRDLGVWDHYQKFLAEDSKK